MSAVPDLSVQHDRAADARADGQAEHAVRAPPRAVGGLAKRGAVDVVFDRAGQAERLLDRGFEVAPRITGDIFIGVQDRARPVVHHAGGRDRDARRVVLADQPADQVEQLALHARAAERFGVGRRFPARGENDFPAGIVRGAVFDRGAANIKA